MVPLNGLLNTSEMCFYYTPERRIEMSGLVTAWATNVLYKVDGVL